MSKTSLHQSFRSITNDRQITDKQIDKFIKWGNNNLQKALNYYFNKKDKAPINKQQSLGIFEQMHKNVKKQQNTLEYIQNLKKQYELPIIGKRKSQQKQQNSKKISDQEQSLNQFSDADYLPDAFNRNKLQPIIQKKGNQFDEQRFQKQDFEEIKPVKLQIQVKQQINKKNNQNTQKSLIIQHKKSKKLYEKFTDKQLYVGEIVVNCVATETRSMADCPVGSPIQFQHYLQQTVKKKSFKKKEAPNLNIRISFKDRFFGRVQDLQARILTPLIAKGLIRIEGEMLFTPPYISFPNKLELLVKIYFQNKAISQPIVQTFMGKADNLLAMYKQVRQQLLALFQKLNLKTLTQPLIKTKSQLNKNQNSNTYSQRSSQNTTEYEMQQKMLREKQEDEIRRRKTDPYYNQVQKTLNFGFIPKKQKQYVKEVNQDIDSQESQEKGQQVHKRTIEMKSDEDAKYTQLIDIYHEDLKVVDTNDNFTSILYNYQSLALAWMLRRQGYNQEDKPEQQEIHPLWTQYEVENCKYHLYFNQLTAQISINRPISKRKCKGGILADEMGLGKTVMMSALIATHRVQNSNKKQGRNLIILPLTLLSQWQSQLKKHTKGLNVIQYYSNQRSKHAKELHQYDVVLTTYGTVAHQFAKANHVTKTGIYKYHWKRIILDQAHYIKGRIIQTAKAVYELQSQYRWCLTGTPIQNGLTDLFSLIHFIRYTPWSEYQCWSRYIEKPFENKEEGIIQILRTLLKRVFLRRTKGSRDQKGNLIVQLPPRTSNVQILQMHEKQRKFYDSVYDASRKKIDDLMEQGVLEAKYMQVLQILMRLRQICCHPALFKSVTKFVKDPQAFAGQFKKFLAKRQKQRAKQIQADPSEDGYDQPIIQQNEQEVKLVHVSDKEHFSEAFFKQTMNKIVKNQLQTCRICLNEIQNPVITICLHIFCKACIIRQIQQNQSCGFCRKKICKEDFMHLPRQNRLDFNTNQQMFRSTKMKALMQHLKKLKEDDKAVIFSQFLGMLDLIQADLNHHKIVYVRMQGSDSHKERAKAIKSFESNKKVQVFLVSLRTAGVGLNLVAANKVFLIDPWWNPGVQQQAIERVHRIGQKRQVNIIRFIMDQSIEMRMLELNMNKKALSQVVMANQVNTDSKAAVLKYLMEKY